MLHAVIVLYLKLGGYARYVAEKQIDGIVCNMGYFYENSVNKKELIDYVKPFSWHNTALQYINFYKSVLF